MKKIYLILLCALFSRMSAQNNALDFSYSDVELGFSQPINFAVSDKFTIEAWVKTTSSIAIIWSNHVDVIPFEGYEVAIVYGKAVMELHKDYASEGLRVETGITVNDGNWHHLAFVYKGIPNLSGCEIFVDGVSQSITANPNNLLASSTITVTNEVHIGSRDNTSYYSSITMDELRVWKRALCAGEIQAHKNCSLIGNEALLEAYYKFNQGTAGGNNSSVTTLTDLTANAHTGTLTGFALSGSSSNWIASTASVSGTCGPYSGGMTISGTNTLCSGSTTTLTANGGITYTWQPGNITTASAIISPTTSTTYTAYATTSASCQLVGAHTLSVTSCVGVNELWNNEHMNIYPNPNQGYFTMELNNETDVIITNALGQTVFATRLNEGKNTLELNNLNNGIYFIYGKNVYEKWQTKIVISR